MIEYRNSSVHFYNSSRDFAKKLQEIGAASLENFVLLAKEWFDRDLSEFNFYLMPLSFVDLPTQTKAIVSNREERNFLNYVKDLEAKADETDSKYFVTINMDVKFLRSRTRDALGVRTTSNPNAPEVRITEMDIREEYPWSYQQLTEKCKKRYADFRCNHEYHNIRKTICGKKNQKLCNTRYLDPGNPRSSKKPFFKPDILNEFDKHYSKKK